MIPKIEKIDKRDNESFVAREYRARWFERSWHYHPEYELLLVTEGHGTRVIGNDNCPFKPGDLVLVSANMPHAWFSDPVYFNENSNSFCGSVYIQFNRSIFGNIFSNLPEMEPINLLLNEARYGLRFLEDKTHPIHLKIKQLPHLQGLERLLNFIEILNIFKNGKYERIVSEEYLKNVFITKSERIKKIHDFVMNNYMNEINLSEIAKMVEMNESSFCRFFKKMTGKTFSNYIKETRIDFAQQLLINTNLPSNQIGFETGFSSVAYFNQCFKSISKKTPLEFRAAYKKI